jgi:hypothetical protein
MTDAKITIQVGRLLCRELRNYLEVLKLREPELRWHEGPGWIERTFTIVGPSATMIPLRPRLNRWRDRVNRDDR